MGPGITLVVIGAILAFAVRTDASAVDLQTVGLILMLAGAAIIAYYRRERHQKEITHVERKEAGAGPSETMLETITHETVYEADEDPQRVYRSTQGLDRK
ncbi:MAG TPA: DUF6458 family protein [Nocardioidaceae bacterium]|nr:DUF6458 family protein [Nocardioidaceae bacterium]